MYNRQKAIEYAQKWALERNPQYYNFDNIGGDCTNYISQCLYAGGISFTYSNLGWFYHSLSSRSPSWTGVDEFFSFGIKNSQINGPKFEISTLKEMEVGDIIQLKVNSKWTHSLIITNIFSPKELSNIIVCSHSYDILNKSLSIYKFDDIRYLKIKIDN